MVETASQTTPGRKSGLGPLSGLLGAQFLGSFNDNAWKQIIILLATKQALSEGEGLQATALAQIAIMIPLLVFSAPAGMLADRLSKRTVIVGMKGIEIAIMLLGVMILSLFPGRGWPALAVLVLLGVQAAFLSPAKYGVLPEILPHEQLSMGNGVLETTNNVAILAGIIAPGLLLGPLGGPVAVAGLLAVLSTVGLACSWTIPRVPAARSSGGTFDTLQIAWTTIRADRVLRLALIGQMLVWAIASLVPAPINSYGGKTLALEDDRQAWPMAALGIGIGLGSLLAGKLSRGKVEYGLLPLGALGLALTTLAFGLVGPGFQGTLVILALMGVSSGLVFVPLSAILQWRSPADRRGAVIAFANMVVFAAMLAGSALALALGAAGLTAQQTFLITSAVLSAGFVWSLTIVPDAFLRFLLLVLAATLYRVRVLGASNIPAQGGALLVPNHVSYADGLFLFTATDRPIRFLVYADFFQRPFMGWVLRSLGAIPIKSSGGPKMILAAFREAGKALDQGDLVCIFPEGQLTRTGLIAPFQRGFERILKGRTTPIVPIHLDRLQSSIFSPMSGSRWPRRIPLPVTVSIGRPLAAGTAIHQIRKAIRQLDQEAWIERKADWRVLAHRAVAQLRRHPFRLAWADLARPRIRGFQALAGAIALGRSLANRWRAETTVAILLPASSASALVNLAAAIAGKTVVNLNFTTGRAALDSALAQAQIKLVLSSRVFLDKARLDPPAAADLVLLEELTAGLRQRDRFFALLLAFCAPRPMLAKLMGSHREPTIDDPATIIFSSGSTGDPKGVVLSHANITANLEAIQLVHPVMPRDRLMSVLPPFHAFGFTLFWFAAHHGMPMIFHPSPLDAAAIGGLIERYAATILPAAPTFLQIYHRRCTPAQFGSLRLILVGAEKLPESLALAFEETFGLRPLEGYGLTECAPVVAVNTFDFRAPGGFQPGGRRGYVGQPLPGVAVRIVDPDTLADRGPLESGLVLIKGPSLMRGYLGRDDLTQAAFIDGWYNSGDIGHLSDDGFLKITGRLSRFSKIGGEMVPHGRIEEALNQALGVITPIFAVTAVGDPKKGERLAVLTTASEDQIAQALAGLAHQGLPNLFIPRRDAFVKVDQIPMLGTGKLDLRALRSIAQERLAAS